MSEAVKLDFLVDGRYKVEELLGSGASADVYRAVDQTDQSVVALKILKNSLIHDKNEHKRFQREADILGKINGANVVKVFRTVWTDQVKAIVMECVDGTDLRKYLHAHGRLKPNEFRAMALQITSALMQCHRALVVHRDLKPQNLLVTKSGEIRVTDFGISRLTSSHDATHTGTVVGTPAYVAPEYFVSARFDQRIDIYSLGCIMYEMLTGRAPFPEEILTQMLQKKTRMEFEPIEKARPDIPAALAAVVRRCLQADPSSRFQTAYEVHTALTLTAVPDRALVHDWRKVCFACKAPLLQGYQLCYQCGQRTHFDFAPGKFYVVINASHAPGDLSNFFEAQFGIKKKRWRFPVVVAKEIDRESARGLDSAFKSLKCQSFVSDKYSKDLSVSFLFGVGATPIIAVLSSYTSYYTGSVLPSLGVIAIYLKVLYEVFKKSVATVLKNLGNNKAAPRKVKSNQAKSWPALVAGLKDARAKAILATAIQNLDRAENSAAALEPLMSKIMKYSQSMSQVFEQLNSSDPVTLRERIQVLDDDIQLEINPDKAAALMESKNRLLQEYEDHKFLTQTYQDYYNHLLNFTAVISRAQSNQNKDIDLEIQSILQSVSNMDVANTDKSKG